jgi:glycosyltransferase involved in cell wall biosynthesis
MRVVLLPGIWPPDVGGPATHGPELARFLVERGHEVRVVTMADGPPSELPCPVETISRAHPFPVRYGRLAAAGARAARRGDVVYASATYAAAAAASVGSGKPLVAKLVSDPAYERARRYGLFGGTLEEFQAASAPGLAALKQARTRTLRRARSLVVPSRYLAAIARGWGIDETRLEVVPNPAPALSVERNGPDERFVFAGRLTRQKALGTALEAVAQVPEARLLVIGDGPERESLERRGRELGLGERVEFAGAAPRREVLRALAGARAAVLSSDWENLPHAAVEALALGTPVVATAVGGVPEVVQDGVNGLLVPPGEPAALARALSSLLESQELRDRLAAGAGPSVAGLDADTTYGRIAELLEQACR